MVDKILIDNPWLADPHVVDKLDGIDVWCTNKACLECQGTGKCHPWAWERCLGLYHKHGGHDRHGITIIRSHDCICDGSGWVLVVTLDKVLDALDTRGYKVQTFYDLEEGGFGLACRSFISDPEIKANGEGPTRLAAALDALYSAGLDI